jgi:hypothetical protein
MFRDAAATFIAEMTPARAMMATAVLQHRQLETTMRSYIHGQQHLAAHTYHAASTTSSRARQASGSIPSRSEPCGP